MKLKYNDPETQSKDLTSENIDQLKKLFPNIVEEGKVNFDVLRQLLGDEVVSEQEYYRFTWPGKHMARQEALKSSTGTLRPARQESVDWDKTQNLYIEGDNLEVLKLLQKSYFNKVKMIYIDPPYNTGKDFVYKDNYKDNLAEYNEKFNRTDADGNVLSSETNNEGNARYHSNWLNMMHPRLQLARNLLKDDGVIFISIDDNEVHNLRRICDEIFGEENFVGEFIWTRKKKGAFLSKTLRKMSEYVLCYIKKSVDYKFYGEDAYTDKKQPLVKRSNSKKDLIFPAGIIKTTLPDGTYARRKSNDNTSISFKNEFEVKNSIVISELRTSANYVWTQDFLNEELGKGTEVYLSTKYGFNVLRHNQEEKIKTPSTIIDKKVNVGTNEDATLEISQLFNTEIGTFFDYTKPVSLIKYLVNMISYNDKDSIILDFFAGSSTTAHAVMDLNKEDVLEGKEGNRKYIMVQLPEPTEEKSEAYKAGYKNIAEIGKERIRRAAKQIKEELKDQPEVADQLDLGFKVFKLDSSNMHTWDTAPEALEDNLFMEEVIKQDRTAEDVLYEVLLKYGLDLTYPIEEVSIDGKKVYSVGVGQLIFCLDNDVTRDTAQAIINWAKEEEIIDTKVVFKDSGFINDVEKTNIIQLFKTHGITDVKSI